MNQGRRDLKKLGGSTVTTQPMKNKCNEPSKQSSVWEETSISKRGPAHIADHVQRFPPFVPCRNNRQPMALFLAPPEPPTSFQKSIDQPSCVLRHNHVVLPHDVSSVNKRSAYKRPFQWSISQILKSFQILSNPFIPSQILSDL